MAERGGKFNREGGGWEYFQRRVTPDGQTEIVSRGEREVKNIIGSCQDCHTRVAADHDSVCEYVIGASGPGLTDAQIRGAQATDPRCQ